jgi:galactokinase
LYGQHILGLQNVMSVDVFKESFVVKEINQVILACEALDNGNIETLGKLMFETHEGFLIL